MIRFASPLVLLLLPLVLPAFWPEFPRRLFSRLRRRKAETVARADAPDLLDIPSAPGGPEPGRGWLRLPRLPDRAPAPSLWLRLTPLVAGLRPAALILLLVALAGPQWGVRETWRGSEGVDVMLAVDLSESMAALDFTLNGRTVDRLTAVKAVVRDFIARRRGDRIGLTAFGSQAYVVVPPTTDHPAVAEALEGLRIGAAGPRTALGDALGACLKRLRASTSKSKVTILLTDGRGNAGELSPETAAVLASRAGVKVHAVGVGGDQPAPFAYEDPLLGRQIVHQRADIDEETLREAAGRTGGLYFRAEDTAGLDKVYRTIDELEKTEMAVRVRDVANDLSPWLLAPALVLLAAWIGLSSTRLLRLP